MAGFLRKKIKQEPQVTRVAAPVTTPPPPTLPHVVVTPLFARFGTTQSSTHGSVVSERLVSSPMQLSAMSAMNRRDGTPFSVQDSNSDRTNSRRDSGRELDGNKRGDQARIITEGVYNPPNGIEVQNQALPSRTQSRHFVPGYASRLSMDKPLPQPVSQPVHVIPLEKQRIATHTPPTSFPTQHIHTPSLVDNRVPPTTRQAPEFSKPSMRRNSERFSMASNGPLTPQSPNDLLTGFNQTSQYPPPANHRTSYHQPSSGQAPFMPGYGPPSRALTSRSATHAPIQQDLHQPNDTNSRFYPNPVIAPKARSRTMDDVAPQQVHTNGHRNGLPQTTNSPHQHQSMQQTHESENDSAIPSEFALFQEYTTTLPSPSSSPPPEQVAPNRQPPPVKEEKSTSRPEILTPALPVQQQPLSPMLASPSSPAPPFQTRTPPTRRFSRPLPAKPVVAPAPTTPPQPDLQRQLRHNSVRLANAPVQGRPRIFAASQGEVRPLPLRPSSVNAEAWDNATSPSNAYPSPSSDFASPTSRGLSGSLPQTPDLTEHASGSDRRSMTIPMTPVTPVGFQAPRTHLASSDDQYVPAQTPRPKLSTRTLASVRSVSDASQHSQHSFHSAVSTSPSRPRTLTKQRRPITPSSLSSKLGPAVELDERNDGIPLDDDPFAKMEGVRVLKPLQNGADKRPSTKDGPDGTTNGSTNGDHHSISSAEVNNLDIRPAPEPLKVGVINPPISAPRSPVSPEEYLQARAARRGAKKDKAPPSLIADIVVREDRPPEAFPLPIYLSDPHLLSSLLQYLSFYDWCTLSSISRQIRMTLVKDPNLREEILERFLKTVGYARWAWEEPDPLSLSLQDLHDYMRGVSIPTHEYARVAELHVQSLSVHPTNRDLSLVDQVRNLSSATRAYSRVVLRLRAQAEREASAAQAAHGYGSAPSRQSSRDPSPTHSAFSHSHHGHAAAQNALPPLPVTPPNSFRSPLFRPRRAPLLRVFVPSPDGDWLSDKSVLECEAECQRAGVTKLMRMGDVVWDIAVGDEGNVGRLVWDGSYLIDLDYTYSSVGDLPMYMPTLAFPPSYFHRVIRTGPVSSNPIVHIDISPWGEEVAINLQLIQDRVRTETPQGKHHNVLRWINRSSFVIHPTRGGPPRTHVQSNSRSRYPIPRIPIPGSNLFVDSGWYGTIVVETEGTNESLADLQERCGPGAFPPRVRQQIGSLKDQENRKVFRVLREKSRPGEIWIRVVGVKERLL